eukprot:gnl/Spiro4/1971_TR941_c1_g1_i1.p1 gnl/Spiro4/1971_TR941_c1_g1~~gnl/Spiro4/1971_TR941_c1_g1_i1.p1  ORF type:complete len:354 (+),score=91.87 gnl/Spiro4/1971_TR941_c1_g1_i1:110-1171(+)
MLNTPRGVSRLVVSLFQQRSHYAFPGVIDNNVNIAGPCRRFNAEGANQGRMSVIGVPMSLGQRKVGVDDGPKVLRQAGLLDSLRNDLDWDVVDCGDIPITNVEKDEPYGKVQNPRSVGLATRKTADLNYREAMRGNVVLNIGGDHCIATGTIGGLLRARPEMCVIWVDAHADINTPETTSSGNLHGMPVAMLMKLGMATMIPGFEWMTEVPALPLHRLAYIGLRDVERGERQLLRQLGIRAFSMHDIDKYGIGRVVFDALKHVNPMRNRPIHLSFDIDGVDPAVTPSTGTTVPGGLSFREAHYIAEELSCTGYLASMDIVEVNPAIHETQHCAYKTVDFAKQIVLSAFGNLPL